jgi:hypothetical protein
VKILADELEKERREKKDSLIDGDAEIFEIAFNVHLFTFFFFFNVLIFIKESLKAISRIALDLFRKKSLANKFRIHAPVVPKFFNAANDVLHDEGSYLHIDFFC